MNKSRLRIPAVIFVVIIFASLSIYFGSEQKINISKNIKKDTEIYVNKNFEEEAAEYFKREGDDWVKLNASSVFNAFVKEDDHQIVNERKVYNRAIFEIDPTRDYKDALITDKDKTIVVYPIFTATAYSDGGFYSYYRNECDTRCLTVKIQNGFPSQANPNAVQVLSLLGYHFITDIDIDKNPSILQQYDKVILLHNEYVTKREFEAIIKHPRVIYLYPNALYAEIKVNYNENTISLIRGHGFPKQDISNGFDWEHDNTKFEYDECEKMSFYKINNGWMLNCYPENAIHKSIVLLKTIKEL